MDQLSKQRLLRRLIGVVVFALVCGYAVLLYSVNGAMHKSPEEFGRFMAKMPGAIFLIAPFETMWTRARAGYLNVGDQSPNFDLFTQDKSTRVSLVSLRSVKPVVLVFGSYT